MSMFGVFDVAATGMNAQNIRLNTIASNLANINSANGDPTKVYRARNPVFETVLAQTDNRGATNIGVRVTGIAESQQPLKQRYEPEHPLANDQGYVFYPNVNMIEEMANMISTSRTFESNVQVADTVKQLMEQTLHMGQ